MRDIKFRAWDKEANYFLNDFVVANDGDIICFDTDGVAQAIDAELMQFTGLQDKNGVDIYEGDIVKSIDNKHYWLYVVGTSSNFGGMLWAIMYENNLSVCDIQDVYTYKKQTVKLGSRRDFVTERVEIIGNIYSNPELLEQ